MLSTNDYRHDLQLSASLQMYFFCKAYIRDFLLRKEDVVNFSCMYLFLGSYFQHFEVQAFNISRFRHITLHLCEGIWFLRLGNAYKNDVDFVIAYLYFSWYFIGLSIIFKFKSQVRKSISDNVTIFCMKSHSNPTKISKLLQGLRDLLVVFFYIPWSNKSECWVFRVYLHTICFWYVDENYFLFFWNRYKTFSLARGALNF